MQLVLTLQSYLICGQNLQHFFFFFKKEAKCRAFLIGKPYSRHFQSNVLQTFDFFSVIIHVITKFCMKRMTSSSTKSLVSPFHVSWSELAYSRASINVKSFACFAIILAKLLILDSLENLWLLLSFYSITFHWS